MINESFKWAVRAATGKVRIVDCNRNYNCISRCKLHLMNSKVLFSVNVIENDVGKKGDRLSSQRSRIT